MFEVCHNKSAMRAGGVMRKKRSRLRTSEILEACRPSEEARASSAFTVKSTLFSSEIFHLCVSPNKALEPTRTAVTPRAIADSCLHARFAGARVAPAVRVAHL